MSSIKFFFSLALIVAVMPLFGQSDVVHIPFDDPSGAKQLKIDLFQGELKIIGTDRADILVDFQMGENNMEENDHEHNHFHEHGHDKHKHKTKKEAKHKEKSKGLTKISGTNTNLEMTSEDNKALIRSHNWNKSIVMKIEVPKDIQLDVGKNIGGNISVENIIGNVNIENNVGDISVKKITGLVNASTNVGNITVDFDKTPESKNMMFTSTTGAIDISLPANYGAALKLKTEMGEIYSDLDMVIKENVEKEETQTPKGKFQYLNDSWTYASLNGGGSEITIKTKLGNIYLRKK